MSKMQRNCAKTQHGLLATTGIRLGLGLALALPLILTGCGSGSGNRTIVGSVASSNLGRAAKLIGSWSSTQTLDTGKTEITDLDFVAASGTESVAGTYTLRVLSPRADGSSDFVSYESGTLSGNILPSGNLSLVFIPDDASKSIKITRAAADGEYSFDGETKLAKVGPASFAGFIKAGADSYKATQGVVGTWSGHPAKLGGFELIDPRDGSGVVPVTKISIKYTSTDNLAFRTYTADVTLTDPATGTSYTAVGTKARLYDQIDHNLAIIPTANLSNVNLSGDPVNRLVTGNGTLPASARPLTLPGVGSLSLAGRPFIYEASLFKGDSNRIQTGAIYVKVDKASDAQLYRVLQYALLNPDATSGYILVARFVAELNQSTAGSDVNVGDPLIGQVLFSSAVGTNANTINILKTEASADFQGNILNCTMTESGKHDIVRDLTLKIYAPDQASIGVGKTFQIVNSANLAAGQARVQYIEEGSQQKYWDATGGTITVVAHNKENTTFRVTNATMTPLNNYGSTNQPTGTFIINAAGQF